MKYFSFLFLTGLLTINCQLQCKNEQGNPVDWFVIYKLPKVSHSSSNLTNGFGYMFMTADSHKQWTVSDLAVDQGTSLLGLTISDFYMPKLNELWLAYNDQPSKTNFGFGHTKGIIGADHLGGFWLVHSIPHFPVLNKYSYPSSGQRYGQSALCLSMSAENIDQIGELLQYNTPEIMAKNMTPSLAALYPKLYDAAKGTIIKKAPWFKSQILTSRKGNQFQAFAKAANFNKDLYEWVANSLKTDLLAETWQNEPDPLPAACTRLYRVMNVHTITIDLVNLTFTSHKDHSKWVTSALSAAPWTCIGDINRAKPQESRGGGTVCLKDKNLWFSYFQLISDKDKC